jgi:hypothetical protein
MQTIWKYELIDKDKQELVVPVGSKILTVKMKHKNPCLWILVNDTFKTEKILIEIFGTGWEIDGEEREYIGTYLTCDDTLVWHVFKRINNYYKETL